MGFITPDHKAGYFLGGWHCGGGVPLDFHCDVFLMFYGFHDYG